MVFQFSDELKNSIHANIESFDRNALTSEGLRRAAVAVVLIADEATDQACVVLTRRSSGVRRHSGQYALPGGRVDRGEDVQTAALREVEEEIGLKLEAASVMGWLDDFVTRSGFCITPVVTWAGSRGPLNPDPREVQAVFRIPLWDLDRPEIPRLKPIEGSSQPVLSAPLQTLGHEIFAPTAAILYQFREVALRGCATRVAHFEQPRFAWK